MLNVAKRVLILCEDKKSSKLYFESFKKDEKLRRELASVSIEVIHPKDYSPIGLVKRAIELKRKAKRERNPYDEVWIVLDRDYHANIENALNMAKVSKIDVALSVICFEYWVLLHFEKTTKPFDKCDDVIKYIKKNHFAAYEKNTNCYVTLKDKVEFAIENGEWVLRQTQNEIDRGTEITALSAYTDVHLLVRKLVNPQRYFT